MTSFPHSLFIETTTRCNLSCPMCARCAPGWRGGFGDMDFALFERLDEPLRHAQAVILNGMGEPLLHPDLPRMIRFVKQRQPKGGWCGLQTNGLLLDARLADELALAGLDVVCISHDGKNAALGHGQNGLDDVLSRAAGLLRAAAAKTGRRLRIGLETVLMRGNVAGLPALVDRAAALGLDFLLASHLLPMDAASEAEGLFLPCSAASLRIFAQHQTEARSRGLDLSGVPRAAVMVHRTPAERELMDLLRRMHERAQAEGVWLNVGRLAQADASRLDELAGLFAEASRRAKAAGLNLHLPALTAPERPQERRCAFVDQEAAFIDWLGNLSPCHFLWHGYACRVLGDEKRVEPRHFGNISAAALADIWHSPPLRKFRETVRKGEYPACGDCGSGLCSDVSGASGPFEQDCLGVSVPCGHCPWSVGQLACLGSASSVRP
jgi:putative metalloenzyme radical SAM/SPASM domain maturase